MSTQVSPLLMVWRRVVRRGMLGSVAGIGAPLASYATKFSTLMSATARLVGAKRLQGMKASRRKVPAALYA